MKADVDGLLHKSDQGAVVLGVATLEDVGKTHDAFSRRFGDRLRGVLVQEQTATGAEFLVGVRRDPAIGPLLVVAAGGVDAELLRDRAVLLAPSTSTEITAAIESLRCAPLLHGYRGRPELPVAALATLVQLVGDLAVTVPEIDELDLNPVIVTPDGAVAVDARIALSPPATQATPLRAMRGNVPTLAER
jgi:hypothetical protein